MSPLSVNAERRCQRTASSSHVRRSSVLNERPGSGTEESKEETQWLKRHQQGRPRRRAAQHPSGNRVDPAGQSGHGSGGRPQGGPAAALRRPRRPRQVFPPQEGLQVLHREDRRHPLPRRASAAGVCGRARQDRAPAADRRLHHAPAPPDPRHQAGPQHRPAAVCHTALRHAGRRRPFRSSAAIAARQSFRRRCSRPKDKSAHGATLESFHGSYSEGRRSQPGPPRRRGEGCRWLWPQFPAAPQAGAAGYRGQQGRH